MSNTKYNQAPIKIISKRNKVKKVGDYIIVYDDEQLESEDVKIIYAYNNVTKTNVSMVTEEYIRRMAFKPMKVDLSDVLSLVSNRNPRYISASRHAQLIDFITSNRNNLSKEEIREHVLSSLEEERALLETFSVSLETTESELIKKYEEIYQRIGKDSFELYAFTQNLEVAEMIAQQETLRGYKKAYLRVKTEVVS